MQTQQAMWWDRVRQTQKGDLRVTKRKFTMISTFSGAMGLDIGLESVGCFSLLAAIEKEPVFRETISLNIEEGRIGSSDTILLGDINEVDPKELREKLGLKPGELDVLVGGPPCQSFSTAGKRGSVLDPRGTLLWRFLDYVVEFRPKVFLMENVRGLVSAALRHRPIKERPPKDGPPLEEDELPSSVLRAFARDLQQRTEGHYVLDGFEVNSVNYGSPQIRERLLVFGNSLSVRIEFPQPTHGSPTEVAATDSKEQMQLFESQSLKPWATLYDCISSIVNDPLELLDFSPRKKSYLDLVPAGSNWRSLPEELQRESMGKAFFAKGGRSGWWRRLTFDLPSPTVVTMPNHASTSLCHPTETRVLSVLEYKRIQEFPDDWVLAGTISEKYRQIGNAVPVRLGRIAGEVIQGLLVSSQCDATEITDSVEAHLRDFRLVYLKSHIRTRQWFKNGKAAIWTDQKDASDGSSRYSTAKTIRRERFL